MIGTDLLLDSVSMEFSVLTILFKTGKISKGTIWMLKLSFLLNMLEKSQMRTKEMIFSLLLEEISAGRLQTNGTEISIFSWIILTNLKSMKSLSSSSAIALLRFILMPSLITITLGISKKEISCLMRTTLMDTGLDFILVEPH
jgi:hypothetical protein